MTSHLKKFISKQRPTFPSQINSSSKNSFCMLNFQKIRNTKNDKQKKNHKFQNSIEFLNLNQKSKTKAQLINSFIGMKRQKKQQKKRSTSSSMKKLTNNNNLNSRIEEKKSQKYILNEPKHQFRQIKSATKQQISLFFNQSKASPNQSLISKQKSIKLIKKKLSVEENSKLKKKNINYLKNINQTSSQQKSSSTIFINNRTNDIEERLSDGMKMVENQSNSLCQVMQFKQFYKNKQYKLQKFKSQNQQNLLKIRSHSISFSKQLPHHQRPILIQIANSYEKIVSELQNLLKKKQNLQHENFKQIPSSKQKLTAFSNKGSQKLKKKDSLAETDYSSSMFTEEPQYKFDENMIQQQQIHKNKINTISVNSSMKLIKKLDNLQNLRRSVQIKPYHAQFLENANNFSQSWKRQLDKQKKF